MGGASVCQCKLISSIARVEKERLFHDQGVVPRGNRRGKLNLRVKRGRGVDVILRRSVTETQYSYSATRVEDGELCVAVFVRHGA